MQQRANVRQQTVLLCVLLALIYIFAFSVIAGAERHVHGFPLDDSYIYQTIARNLGQHGSLGFTADRRSSGATSPLWAFLQAANYRFLQVDPVWYNLAISYVLLASMGPLLFLLARRDAVSVPLACALAIAPAMTGNFLWLGMIGMEHLLFVVLSLIAVLLWLEPAPRSRHNTLFCGLIAGLLAITRPEDMIFGPLLIALSLLPSFGRTWRDRLILFAGWAPFAALMIANNLWTSGTLMPATLNGRSWLYFHQSGGRHSMLTIARFIGSWVERLPRQFSTRFLNQPHSIVDLGSPAGLLAVLLLILIALGAFSVLFSRRANLRLLLLWAATQFAIYLVNFPAGGHGGRYQPLNLFLLLPLLLLGVHRLLRLARVPSHAAAVAVIGTTLVAGALSLPTWARVTYVGIEHINDTEGQIAQWMRANVPTTNRHFAAFDIGRVSYDWGGPVTDLGGLVDPAYYHYLQDGRVPEYLRARHIEYLMLPSAGMQDLGLNLNSLPPPAAEFCSDPETWLLGFRYTIHATRCQSIYRLRTP